MAECGTGVVQGAAALADHAWPVLVAVIASLVIVCVTTVVLVLAVERGRRVEAIQELPDLITAIVGRTPSRSIRSGRDTLRPSTHAAERESCAHQRPGCASRPAGDG